METIKNKKSSLNGEGERELENLNNELRYLKMRISFAQQDIKFFESGLKITKNLIAEKSAINKYVKKNPKTKVIKV